MAVFGAHQGPGLTSSTRRSDAVRARRNAKLCTLIKNTCFHTLYKFEIIPRRSDRPHHRRQVALSDDKVSTDDRACTVYSVCLSEVSLHAGARSFHHGQLIIHGPNISTTYVYILMYISGFGSRNQVHISHHATERLFIDHKTLILMSFTSII